MPPILSARAVNEDIALQFGRVLPAFLPLRGKRLFPWQAALAAGDSCAMTLPYDYDYDIAPVDARAGGAATDTAASTPSFATAASS